MRRWAALLLLAPCSVSACSLVPGGDVAGGPSEARPPLAASSALGASPGPTTVPPPAPPSGAPATTAPEPAAPSPTDATVPPAAPAPPARVTVPLALESRVADVPTERFAATVREVLVDTRGWTRAGFVFTFAADAPYRVVLAEPDEVDRLCHPYGTGGRWSCQNGPLVVLNAQRWRTATASWPESVDSYRTMLVNHEVGHLLGQHHPAELCASAGEPAAVMGQQSKGLQGCVANLWPLDWEVTCAARHSEPLAPPYEAESEPSCAA